MKSQEASLCVFPSTERNSPLVNSYLARCARDHCQCALPHQALGLSAARPRPDLARSLVFWFGLFMPPFFCACSQLYDLQWLSPLHIVAAHYTNTGKAGLGKSLYSPILSGRGLNGFHCRVYESSSGSMPCTGCPRQSYFQQDSPTTAKTSSDYVS